ACKADALPAELSFRTCLIIIAHRRKECKRFLREKPKFFSFFAQAVFPGVRAPFGPFSPAFGRLAALIQAARAIKAIPQAPIPPKKMQEIFPFFVTNRV
ncbi:MAG TPA: hypothetical protein H9964_00085, partial [Candidatus Gallimonas intestinavium]|nr:hypothetical protein [Candidatus Gallimonas intestinavium]